MEAPLQNPHQSLGPATLLFSSRSSFDTAILLSIQSRKLFPTTGAKKERKKGRAAALDSYVIMLDWRPFLNGRFPSKHLKNVLTKSWFRRIFTRFIA